MENARGHLRLRLPETMRDAFKESATRNRRSMNSEIVFHLANVLANQGKTATGQSLPAHPAAVPEQPALAGGVHIHQGL